MPKNPHADFTPTLAGYSGITPFRFWCQTALPLTYDDSLSYYELLNKVVNYLNHTIEDLTNVENNTSELAEAYDKLQKYVNDYFDDIDIEAELRNVLDGMAEDGTLDALLDPLVANRLPGVVEEQIYDVVAAQIDEAVEGQIDGAVEQQLPPLVDANIGEEVSQWLEDNVDPVGSAVLVDSTLTISGAAADAKVTGDELNALKSGEEYLFTDLTNWSNGYFSSTGTISAASQSIVAMQEPYPWPAGKMITIDPDGLSGDIITFSYNGSAYSRTGAETFTTAKSFTFTEDTYIGLQFKKIPQASISPSEFTGTIKTYTMIYEKVLKNENDIGDLESNIIELENGISDVDAKVDRIATMDGGTVIDLLNEELETNKYWGNGGLISVNDPYKDYYAAGTLIPVEPGQNIILRNMGIITNVAPAIIGMYDNDGQDAPGRVNLDSAQIISSVINDGFIKEVRIRVDDNATQIGLFFAVQKGTVIPGGISYTPECQLDNGSFAFTEEAENAISTIVGDILNDTTIEAEDIIADYYIKGESPKLERTKKLCIIGAGQSNIEGRVPVADLPDYITLPMPGMYMERNTTSGVFVNNYPSTSLWSFDLVTCYNLIQNLGTDNLYYIKWTQGGTSIDLTGDGSAHWTPDYETLAPQNALILQFNKEIEASIVNNPDDFEIGAMIWHQGESDRASYSQTAANNYYKNLKKVIAFCRGIAKNDCLPFICGTISENSAQYDTTIDAAIRRIGNEDPYVYVIDMKNAVLLDNYHFNAEWSEYLGEKVYDALIDAKVITGTKINPSEPA